MTNEVIKQVNRLDAAAENMKGSYSLIHMAQY